MSAFSYFLLCLILYIGYCQDVLNFTFLDPTGGVIGINDHSFGSVYDLPNPYPGARYQHTVAYGNRTLYMFGGYVKSFGDWSCEFWRYYVDENRWEFVESDPLQRGGNCYRNDTYPGGGDGVQSTYFNDYFYMIGGVRQGYTTGRYFKNDIWRINKTSVDWDYMVVNDEWTEEDIQALYTPPYRMGGRTSFCLVRRNESSSRFYAFGGFGKATSSTVLLSDIFSIDLENLASGWELEFVHEEASHDFGNYDDFSEPLRPMARRHAGCWSHDGKLYLYGGLTSRLLGPNDYGASSLSDLWTFDYHEKYFNLLNFRRPESNERLSAYNGNGFFDSIDQPHPGRMDESRVIKFDNRSVIFMFGAFHDTVDGYEERNANIWRYDLLYKRFVLMAKRDVNQYASRSWPGAQLGAGVVLTEDRKFFMWGGHGFTGSAGPSYSTYLGQVWMINDTSIFSERFCGGLNVSGELAQVECACDERWIGEDCNDNYTCYGHLPSTTAGCSFHGYCSAPDVCLCETNFTSFDCSVTSCYGILGNENDVCNGHGDCYLYNNCSCRNGYSGAQCNLYGCGVYQRADNNVCSGVGICIAKDYCQCPLNYRLGSDNVTCILCLVGEVSDSNDTYSCEACPAGYSSSPANLSLTTCFYCGRGDVEIDGVCQPCPAGTYQPQIGVSGVDRCSPCHPGYFSSEPGLTQSYFCTACPVGTRQPYFGKNYSESCVPCLSGYLCPRGSPGEFRTLMGTVEEKPFHSKKHNLKIEGVNYVTKLIVFGGILFAAFLLLVLIVLCSYSFCCCCCGRLIFKKCCSFQAWDRFFSMGHDVEEGGSAVKKSTVHGGVLSIFALSITFTLVSWSIADFYLGNRRIRERTEFYFQDVDNPLQGDMLWGVTFYGDYENCSIIEEFSGFKYDRSTVTVKRLEDHLDGANACRVELDCRNCSFVELDNLKVGFSLDFELQFNRMLEFDVRVPHCDTDQEYYLSKGRLFTSNGTLDDSSVTISFFQSVYQRISTWDLFLGILDTKIEIDPSLGMGSSILTVNKNEQPDVMVMRQQLGKSRYQFTFEVQLSNFAFVVEEYFNQSLLNLIAQIFALFGLSVSIMGLAFSCLEGCFGRISWLLLFTYTIFKPVLKKKKVSPEEEGEENMEKKSVDAESVGEEDKSDNYVTTSSDNTKHNMSGEGGEEDSGDGGSDNYYTTSASGSSSSTDITTNLEDEDEGEEEESFQEFLSSPKKDGEDTGNNNVGFVQPSEQEKIGAEKIMGSDGFRGEDINTLDEQETGGSGNERSRDDDYVLRLRTMLDAHEERIKNLERKLGDVFVM